ncbi:MAG: CDC48 family AAA ATPase [Candidatus Pacearchaeota archaeon]
MGEQISQLKLKVADAMREEAYKGIARIDRSLMKQIGVNPGDIISIKGQRETVAIVDRAYPADIGEPIIRIDGIIRRNAKTSIGEYVIVKRVEAKEAEKVTIAPAQKGVIARISPVLLRSGLLGRAVVKGDIIVLGRRRRLFDEGDSESDGFEEFFSAFEEAFGGSFSLPYATTRFYVVNTKPKDACIITDNTEVELLPRAVEIIEERVPEVTYEDIGGLYEEINKIREMVELPLKHPEIFERLGIEAPKGVLLYGPPGTGKTLLAKAVANESEANFFSIAGPEIMSKFYGESEKRIRDIFEQAEKNAPSIIFIDEIDAIAPKREESYGEVERRVVSQLLTMMDGLKARGKVIVIAATNRPNAIDPALRRPGRFDREIAINVPNKKARLEILKIHTRNMPLDKDVDLDKIASITHGFVGADISALCKEAAMSSLRRLLPNLDLEKDELPPEMLEKLKVTMQDFNNALRIVRPSAMREVLVETPNVKWQDIGGLEEAKQAIIEAVEWPLKNPEAFKKLGIEAPKGVLLYGPSGTGKTLLAKAVATESEANFIYVAGPSLLSKWVGESEKGIRQVFERARQVAPCIIFFDEIDAIASKRGYDVNRTTERMLNQMLAELDGLQEIKGIVVIAATNRPDILDSALLRPGRFDKLIYIGPPDEKARLEILKIHTKNMPLDKSVDLKVLAKTTENYSGADLNAICKEAGLAALRENKNASVVKLKHFEEAMKKIKPSITKEEVARYKNIEKKIREVERKETTSYTG